MLSHVPQRYLKNLGMTQQQIDEEAVNDLTVSLEETINTGQYGWDNRNTPGMAGCQDYLLSS